MWDKKGHHCQRGWHYFMLRGFKGFKCSIEPPDLIFFFFNLYNFFISIIYA